MKKKRGVREEVKERVKMILVTTNIRLKKEWALLNAILENENKFFTAAVILSAVANGRFVLTMSWQIVAPALVTSLSSVLYHWILL